MGERLTDKRLNALVDDDQLTGEIAVNYQDVMRMVHELKARRALDLTPDEVEALRWLREAIRLPPDWAGPKARDVALAALDKLLSHHEAKP